VFKNTVCCARRIFTVRATVHSKTKHHNREPLLGLRCFLASDTTRLRILAKQKLPHVQSAHEREEENIAKFVKFDIFCRTSRIFTCGYNPRTRQKGASVAMLQVACKPTLRSLKIELAVNSPFAWTQGPDQVSVCLQVIMA
jgi:hypothetical protein